MFIRLFAFFVVLFLMLFDITAVSAQGFPSDIFNFPTFKPFPFPSKSPKPTNIPAPSSTPAPTPTAAPVPTGPEIEDVDPSSANFMEEFTVFGSGFGANPGNLSFRYYNQGFPSAGAPIVSWSDSEITARVPAVKKGSYRIQVITGDNEQSSSSSKKSNEIKFTVKNGQPIINSTSLSFNNGESELTFQGTEFGSKRGTIEIYNGDNLAGTGVIKSWSSSRVRFEIPSLPAHEYGFQLTTSDGRKTSFKFFTVGN